MSEPMPLGPGGVEWVKGYRAKTGCSLREAAAAYRARAKMPPSEVERLREINTLLYEAAEELLDVMEMQEKRETGEFHVPSETALCIWRDAQAAARAALARARGEETP